jgi:serine/threonine-protein kinase
VTARLSPNGEWLAYSSDETKRYEVYVGSFPNPATRWQISSSGGRSPVWSHDSKKLFFVGPDGKMMAVEVKTGAKFEASAPSVLFDTHLGVSPGFDVSKDGRFLIPTILEQSANAPMTVVLNWQAGMKK